jgi:hypothetical protein
MPERAFDWVPDADGRLRPQLDHVFCMDAWFHRRPGYVEVDSKYATGQGRNQQLQENEIAQRVFFGDPTRKYRDQYDFMPL